MLGSTSQALGKQAKQGAERHPDISPHRSLFFPCSPSSQWPVLHLAAPLVFLISLQFRIQTLPVAVASREKEFGVKADSQLEPQPYSAPG